MILRIKSISFLLTNKLNTVDNVAVLNKSKSSDYMMMRCKITLDLTERKREVIQIEEAKYPSSQKELR